MLRKTENTSDVRLVIRIAVVIGCGTHGGGYVALVDASADDVTISPSPTDNTADFIMIGRNLI